MADAWEMIPDSLHLNGRMQRSWQPDAWRGVIFLEEDRIVSVLRVGWLDAPKYRQFLELIQHSDGLIHKNELSQEEVVAVVERGVSGRSLEEKLV